MQTNKVKMAEIFKKAKDTYVKKHAGTPEMLDMDVYKYIEAYRASGAEDAAVFDYVTVRQEGELAILHYNVACVYGNMWDEFDGALRDCRGLVIALPNMEVILRPYSKFFNLGEKPETQPDIVSERIANAKHIEFADKMDGSLVCARYYHSSYVLATSGMLNEDNCLQLHGARKFIETVPGYKEMMSDYRDYTFMFEYVAPDDPHIVDYAKLGFKPGLYLHGMRNVATGESRPYSVVSEIAETYNILHVSPVPGATLDYVLKDRKKHKYSEKEGYVMFADGFFVKLKCDDYLEHAIKLINVTNPNMIIKKYADGSLSEFMDDITGPTKEYIQDFVDEIMDFEEVMNDAIAREYTNLCLLAGIPVRHDVEDITKNQRMVFFANLTTVPKFLQEYIRAEFKGDEWNLFNHKQGFGLRNEDGSLNWENAHILTYSEMKNKMEQLREYLTKTLFKYLPLGLEIKPEQDMDRDTNNNEDRGEEDDAFQL